MIGVDTNVLVRFIMQDDAAQARAATRFLTSLTPNAPGYVSIVALAELYWALTQVYGASRLETAAALKSLLEARSIIMDRADCVARALLMYQSSNVDFADALIAELNGDAGCVETRTFDKNAAKRLGMTLLT